MKIQELIAKLAGLPMDSEVVIRRKAVFLPSEAAEKIKAEETLPITAVLHENNLIVLVCKGDHHGA